MNKNLQMNTEQLIRDLSKDAATVPLRSPAYFAGLVWLVLAVYGGLVQFMLSVRPDLLLQMTRPLFVMEIILLVGLLISSAAAAILSMYPDNYQQRLVLKLPYGFFILLTLLIVSQLGMHADARMVFAEAGAHALECALCVAAIALVPSILILSLLRKGASVNPLSAGSFAVLSASAVGGLTLRLSEANDALEHLVVWHYLPTLVFALLGAMLGRLVLKW